MPRITIKELQEEIEEIRKELQEIKEMVSSTTAVQFVREVRPTDPLSEPLDFQAMSRGLAVDYQSYYEGDEFWGANKYL